MIEAQAQLRALTSQARAVTSQADDIVSCDTVNGTCTTRFHTAAGEILEAKSRQPACPITSSKPPGCDDLHPAVVALMHAPPLSLPPSLTPLLFPAGARNGVPGFHYNDSCILPVSPGLAPQHQPCAVAARRAACSNAPPTRAHWLLLLLLLSAPSSLRMCTRARAPHRRRTRLTTAASPSCS